MTLFRSIPIKVAADGDKFIQTATTYYGDETGQVADDIIQLALKIKVKRKDIDDLKRQFDEDKDGHSRKYFDIPIFRARYSITEVPFIRTKLCFLYNTCIYILFYSF